MLARAAPPTVAMTTSRHRPRATTSCAIARGRAQPLAPGVGGARAVGAPSPSPSPLPRRHCRSRCAATANDGEGGGGQNDDNDLLYVAKLAVFSLAGAAAIKYGSLLVALPHEPSLPVALAVVLGTPALYSAWLLSRR